MSLLAIQCNKSTQYKEMVRLLFNNIPNHRQNMSESFGKKYSKISSVLRYQLLNMIFRQGSTIKDAAAKFGINYSTAKAIVRQNGDEFNNGDWESEQFTLKKVQKRCSYRAILSESVKLEAELDNTSENGVFQKHQEQYMPLAQKTKPIQIFSRVEWNYIEK